MKKNILILVSIVLGLLLILLTAYLIYRNQFSASTTTAMTEICDNGMDDNGDGKIDENCWDPKDNYSVSGTSYYVSTIGKDTNSGTEESPFKTIQKAADIAVAGDGIFINSGTYSEVVSMVNSGTVNKPIIVKGIGNTKPIISCDLSCSSDDQHYGKIRARSNTIIENIKFDGVQAIKSGQKENGGYGVWVYNDKNILIKNCEFTQLGRAVFGERGDRLIVRDSYAYKNTYTYVVGRDSGSDANPIDYFTNTLFENDQAADSVYNDNTDGFVIEGGRGHHMFKNCVAHGFSDAGFDIKSRVIIDNSIAYGNGQIGFKLWRNGTLRNDIAYNNSGDANYVFGGLDPDWKLVNSVSYNGKVRFEDRDLSSSLLSATSVKVSHNIFYKTQFQDEIGGVLTKADHNIYYDSGINSTPEKTSKNTDPKFVNLANYDFQLQSSSPAINAGTSSVTSYMIGTDILGNNRKTGSAVDIGPYEYASSEVDEEPEPTCSDGVKNGDETGIDCGGSCANCQVSTNSAPVFTTYSTYSILAGRRLSFTVSANDPDGDDVYISAVELPSGAKFKSNVFSWKPASNKSGTYQVTFKASDSQNNSTDQVVSVKVRQSAVAVEKRNVYLENRLAEPMKFQVCRNSLYTKRYLEVFTFGDGSNYLTINEPERSRCSNYYYHAYEKPGEYQFTLYLCEKDNKGQPKNCFPNIVRRVIAR